MKKLLTVAAVLLVLVPLGIWWFSPEQVIKRRTNHLMEVLTISDGTGGPLRQAKVFSINGMVAPEVEITSPEIADANGTFDKQEIESAFSWICRHAKQSQFRVTEFHEVETDGESARTRVGVEGFLQLPSYRPADGTYEVTIDWIKGGDGWRFEKVLWKED